MTDLTLKKCVPCEGDQEPLSRKDALEYVGKVSSWDLSDDTKKISRTFKFKDFMEGIGFVNDVARLAEDEGHHPDISIRYRKVTLELTTHAIKGLSENDFIMASKVDLIYEFEERVNKTLTKAVMSPIFIVLSAIVLLIIFIIKLMFY